MNAGERSPRSARTLLLAAAALALGACGDVEVGTDMTFPKPLVEELPMTVGIYYSDEFRKYVHDESRWGVDWKVELGQYHVRMGEKLFDAAFRDIVVVKSLQDLPHSDPLRAVIEPRIEQYSFITPRDTGAKYYAVTIRYRLNVFAPDGRLADSLTFTGYGSSPSSGLTSTNPMILATRTAMRDAAAKFLVQFPEQPITKKMIAQLPLIEEGPTVAGTGAPTPVQGDDGVAIESVPLVDTAHPSGSTPANVPGASQPAAKPASEPTSQDSGAQTPAPQESTQQPAGQGTNEPDGQAPADATKPENAPSGSTPEATPSQPPADAPDAQKTPPASPPPESAPPKAPERSEAEGVARWTKSLTNRRSGSSSE